MNHHIEFLVRPGEGEDFVYSPVEVSATFHSAVNDTYLVWEVDRLNFLREMHSIQEGYSKMD